MVFSLFIHTSINIKLIQVVTPFFIACVFYLSSVQSILAEDNLVKPCSSEAPNDLRLAVVSRGNSIESRSLYSGVLESCADSKWATPIKVTRYTYDKIRKQQFEKMGPVINHIAYANSRPYLMSTLLESHGFAGDDERKQTLKDKLQVKLDKQQTILGTRKVLAKEVFNEVSWAKLQERRIVPRDTKPADICDPEPIVDVSVQYCFRNNPDCLGELEKLVNSKLKNSEYAELKLEFTENLASSNTPRAKISSCIRWSILLLDESAESLPEKIHLTTTADDAAVKLDKVQAMIVNSRHSDDGKDLIGLCWEKITQHSRGNINGYLRSVLEA